jgi:hypothetical protein
MYQSERRRRIRFGSALFCGCLFIAGAFGPTRLKGETLILESVADGPAGSGVAGMRGQEARMPGTLYAGFRTWNLARWRVDTATLFVHLARGETPRTVEIAILPGIWSETDPPSTDPARLKFVSHDVQHEPEDWLAIAVDLKVIEELIATKSNWLAVRVKNAATLHTRETRKFIPYLIVMGGRG